MLNLHTHPASTAGRSVVLFCAESGIELEMTLVDLMTGKQFEPPYRDLNPNCLVPTLVDGDLVLTESSAILKYLADKYDSPAYPKDVGQRARVNERLDWFNTQCYREFGYRLVYPQVFPHHKLATDEATAAVVKQGQANCARFLPVLENHWLGGRLFTCGDQITIADYFGASILTIGDWIGERFDGYPNIQAWLGRMRALPHWAKVNEVFDGFAKSLQGKDYVTLAA